MNPTLRVALHGFSDFEQRALGSFFLLAAPPALALQLVPDIAAAQLIVADADHPGGIAALLAAQRVGMDSDLALGSAHALDGLALCQHIKRQHRHVGGRSPVLVLVSAHHSELDRARGAFAGCDHYLAKPAAEEALHQLLSQHRSGPAPRASRQ